MTHTPLHGNTTWPSDCPRFNYAQLEPVSKLTALLPKTSHGRTISRKTLYRWMDKGKAGLRLPYVQIERTRYSTAAAIAWWLTQVIRGASGNTWVDTDVLREVEIKHAVHQARGALRIPRTVHKQVHHTGRFAPDGTGGLSS